MPTVVQIGAGSIGRGFLGQLWCEAGYETIFVDVSAALVIQINQRGSYPLHLVGTNSAETRSIAPCRAVVATDRDAVQEELYRCVFAATAVGARYIESVARDLVAPVLPHRTSPLNVLLCENGLTIHDDFLRGIEENAARVGAVETVIARMVPVATGAEDDPLAVYAEPYYRLPFNRAQWYEAMPEVPGLIPVPGADFPAYELHKLYLHNGGHAALAYHGFLHGYEYIWQCAEDAAIVAELRGFWREVSDAFARSSYQHVSLFTPAVLAASTDDLLMRFRNRHLADSVARVARDPARKLAPNDRLVGAALFCLQAGIDPVYIARAIAAALHYQNTEQPENSLNVLIKRQGSLDPFMSLSTKPLPTRLLALVGKAYSDLAAN